MSEVLKGKRHLVDLRIVSQWKERHSCKDSACYVNVTQKIQGAFMVTGFSSFLLRKVRGVWFHLCDSSQLLPSSCLQPFRVWEIARERSKSVRADWESLRLLSLQREQKTERSGSSQAVPFVLLVKTAWIPGGVCECAAAGGPNFVFEAKSVVKFYWVLKDLFWQQV